MSDTAKEILDAKIVLAEAMSSYINTRGPNNPGAGSLAELYARHGLPHPPKSPDLSGLNTRTRIAFRAEERAMEFEAISMNDINDTIEAIINPETITPENPEGDAFGSIADVIAWVTNKDHGMGPVGVDIASTLNAWLRVRPDLGGLISPEMLEDHSAVITKFTNDIVAEAGNIK